jgi:hypothetical protein
VQSQAGAFAEQSGSRGGRRPNPKEQQQMNVDQQNLKLRIAEFALTMTRLRRFDVINDALRAEKGNVAAVGQPFLVPAPPMNLFEGDKQNTVLSRRLGWALMRKCFLDIIVSDEVKHIPAAMGATQSSPAGWSELLDPVGWKRYFPESGVPLLGDKDKTSVRSAKNLSLAIVGHARAMTIDLPKLETQVEIYGRQVSRETLSEPSWGLLIMWEVNEIGFRRDLRLIDHHFLIAVQGPRANSREVIERRHAYIQSCVTQRAFSSRRTIAGVHGIADTDPANRRPFMLALAVLMEEWWVGRSPVLPYEARLVSIHERTGLPMMPGAAQDFKTFERLVLFAYVKAFREALHRLPTMPFMFPGIPDRH